MQRIKTATPITTEKSEGIFRKDKKNFLKTYKTKIANAMSSG